MAEGDDREQPPQPPNSNDQRPKFVINIPSYEEAMESSQPRTVPSSFFEPSTSFSQAFNFLKNSDFYSPPPPPPPPQPPSSAIPRQIGQSEGPSTSSTPSFSAYAPVPSRNAILVSHRQKGNPLLKHIRNARWSFADVVCDYSLGQNACALYLSFFTCSLRYHLLHPDYLYYRIRELPKNFKLRVVLCHVDVEDVVKPLLEVTKTALLHDCTLLCGWSLEECGRYLETIKVYENKPADLIQGQMDSDYLSRLNHALTTVRHVNKTDVVTLGSTFGSLSNIMDASMEDLARCPGIGERKVKRLYDTFHEPFKRVVPIRPSVPENSVHVNAEATSASENKEDDKEIEDANKKRKKESELAVKSALSVAFAKYSDRIGRKNNNSEKNETEEESIATVEANDEPMCIGKGPAGQ
ncbi:DNA excision repair protein ERCC-1-like isoform X1 [Coffea arabica]|uniref:DNA excision repair protein ERCC-1-like isoform X1 n=1 Tax=Coffea arabica TaxID=13443 RepID=A0ABM4WYP3_COFAR